MATSSSVDTTAVDDLDETQTRILNQRVKETVNKAGTPPQYYRNTPHGQNPQPKQLSSTASAILHYLGTSLSNYLFSVITAPQTLFHDPFGGMLALIEFPFVHIGVWIIWCFFVVCKACGGDKLWDWFDTQYGFGLSAVNFVDPGLLYDPSVKQLHNTARKSLSNAYGLPLAPSQVGAFEYEQDQQVTPTRFFNLDIAKSLLILSALVYEREDNLVDEADKVARDETLDPGARRREVAKLLIRSTHTVRSVAKQWGLNFASISDFINIGGPFCGMYYPASGDERWIVLAVKGTSPDSFADILSDAAISHQNADAFFGGGNVHSGFFASVAPSAQADTDPYANIIYSLKHLARSMRKGSGEKVNLWITGHSLGSAIASLLHARLLFCPSDLGPDIVLRQGYVYGAPRVASSDFIARFDYAASQPFGDTTRSLWRVIDRWDIVTHVPPGLADQEANQDILPETSMLNYGHFGIGVHLTGVTKLNPSGWEIEQGSLRGGSCMQIVEKEKDPLEESESQSNEATGLDLTPKTMTILGYTFDPIQVIKNVLQCIGPLYDHFPTNYSMRLQSVKADLEVHLSDDPPKTDA